MTLPFSNIEWFGLKKVIENRRGGLQHSASADSIDLTFCSKEIKHKEKSSHVRRRPHSSVYAVARCQDVANL